MAAARGSRAALEQLSGPEFPEALDYLAEWSEELTYSRRYGMDGPEAITYADIDAWARLTGRHPHPMDVQALLQLDRVRLYPDSIKGEDG